MGNGKSERRKGIIYILTAAGLNGLLPLLVTTVYDNGGHFTNIMLYKGVFIVPVVWILCRAKRVSMHIERKQNMACAFIAFFQFLTSVLLYSSYALISTGIATTLHFMYPVAVLIFGAILFHEVPQRKEIVCLLLCVGGIVILCGSNEGGKQNVLGMPIALLSGAVYAGYILMIGIRAIRELQSLLFTFYIFFYNMVFSGMVSFTCGTIRGLTGTGWAVMAVSALAAGLVAVLFQRGIKNIGSQTASILCVAEPLVSILVGVIFMGEPFSVRLGCGVICVLLSTVLVSR